MILPHPFAFIRGSTSRVARTQLSRVSSKAFTHVSSSKLSKVPAGGPPALFTRTSTEPVFSEAKATSRFRSPGRVTSHGR